jgi:hypothetical protein
MSVDGIAASGDLGSLPPEPCGFLLAAMAHLERPPTLRASAFAEPNQESVPSDSSQSRSALVGSTA